MVLTRLRFFRDSPQGPEPDATGYKGFYYHFLDMKTGRRVWAVRALDHRLDVPPGGHAGRRHLLRSRHGRRARDPHARRRALPPRGLALGAERRGDRHARLDAGGRLPALPLAGLRRGPAALRARPRVADLPAPRGELLRLGLHLPVEDASTVTSSSTRARSSPTSSRTSGSTSAASRTPSCATGGSTTSRTAGGRPTSSGSTRSATRWSSRATAADCWGITASDGPGWTVRKIDGIERHFFDYIARGVPYGPDDGTIAPWAVVASLPFAPEIVLPTIRHFMGMDLGVSDVYGFRSTFNRTFKVDEERPGLGVALSLRDRPGADRPDDRELPDGPPLGADAAVPLHRRGASPGALHQRLALTSGSGGRACGGRGGAVSSPISGCRPPSGGRSSRTPGTSRRILS